MSAAPAYLPLFGSDYLADTRHLTTEEHGAYLLLMIAAWRQDDCGLPCDDKKLARIVGLSTRKWGQIKDTILEFWTVQNERIYQPRLHKEWVYACKKSEGNRQNARKRWEKQPTENIEGGSCDRISDGNAPQPQPQVEEEPNGSPSKGHEPRKRRDSGTDERTQGINPRATGTNHRSNPSLSDDLPDWMPSEQWAAFLEMRSRKRAKPTAYAATKLIAKLGQLRSQGHDPGQVLDQSTLKNWTDVYPIKDRDNGNHPHQPRDTRDAFQRVIDRELDGFAAERASRAAGRHDDPDPPGLRLIGGGPA